MHVMIWMQSHWTDHIWRWSNLYCYWISLRYRLLSFYPASFSKPWQKPQVVSIDSKYLGIALISGNTELSGHFALTHGALIVAHTHTYTRNHSLAWFLLAHSRLRRLDLICGHQGAAINMRPENVYCLKWLLFTVLLIHLEYCFSSLIYEM